MVCQANLQKTGRTSLANLQIFCLPCGWDRVVSSLPAVCPTPLVIGVAWLSDVCHWRKLNNRISRVCEKGNDGSTSPRTAAANSVCYCSPTRKESWDKCSQYIHTQREICWPTSRGIRTFFPFDFQLVGLAGLSIRSKGFCSHDEAENWRDGGRKWRGTERRKFLLHPSLQREFETWGSRSIRKRKCGWDGW